MKNPSKSTHLRGILEKKTIMVPIWCGITKYSSRGLVNIRGRRTNIKMGIFFRDTTLFFSRFDHHFPKYQLTPHWTHLSLYKLFRLSFSSLSSAAQIAPELSFLSWLLCFLYVFLIQIIPEVLFLFSYSSSNCFRGFIPMIIVVLSFGDACPSYSGGIASIAISVSSFCSSSPSYYGSNTLIIISLFSFGLLCLSYSRYIVLLAFYSRIKFQGDL